MHFAEPWWLVAGFAASLILALAFIRQRQKRRALLQAFAATRLLPELVRNVSPARRAVKSGLLVLAVFLIFAALARPQWGYEYQEVHRKGLDVVFALDTSKSMLAQDVAPSRLERAKLAILDFVSRLPGDRVGLIPFGGEASLLCPLTLDREAFARSLEAATPGVVPGRGTDLASAIREAGAALAKGANHKILVLVTDGEDLTGQAVAAAKSAAENGLAVYAVGVGTPAGELIPVAGANGGTEFLKDPKGQFVRSRLDEKGLAAVARAGEGTSHLLGQKGEGLAAVYEDMSGRFTRAENAERLSRTPIERFSWPLALALILLAAEHLIGERRTDTARIRRLVSAHPRRAALITGALLLALLIPLVSARAADTGFEAFQKGDFDKAAETYAQKAKDNPDDPAVHFNLGAADYRKGDFEAAEKSFQASLGTKDVGLQNRSYYNLGNTLYRQGEGMLKEGPDKTIAAWEKAVEAYEGALALNGKDEDAHFNRDFVKKRLEELKKQQNQQNNQCSKDDQKDDQNKNGGGSSAGNGKDQKDRKDKNESAKNNQKSGNGQDQDQDRKQSAENNQGKGKDQDREQSADNSGQDKKDGKGEKSADQKSKDRDRDRQSAQNKAGDKGREKQDQAQKPGQQNQSPKNAGDKGSPMMADNRPAQTGPRSAAENQGRMTKEQAESLLNALDGEARPLLPAAMGQKPPSGSMDETRRDW